MIISRKNLLIYKMTSQDKSIPILDNVFICKDGSSVASNGMSAILISPVDAAMLEHVIVEDSGGLDEVLVSTESIKEVLKNLPKDTKFAGVLEHCSVGIGRGGKCKFKVYDGKRTRAIDVKHHKKSYIDYRKTLKTVRDKKVSVSTAINLSRLNGLIAVINEICVDSSHDTPVYIDFTSDGDILIRCLDYKTKQRVIAVMKAYDGVEGNVPELSSWERDVLGNGGNGGKRKISKVKRKKLNDGDSNDKKVKRLSKRKPDKKGIAKLRKKVKARKINDSEWS